VQFVVSGLSRNTGSCRYREVISIISWINTDGRIRFGQVGVCALVTLLNSCLCLAQHGEPLDVSQCFPSILQESKVNITKENIRYALLSSWDKELYESTKSRANMETFVPAFGYSNNEFEGSQTNILKEFYSKNENLEYTRDTASAELYLDAQAGEVIEACLDAMTRSRYGLSSAYFLDDAYKVTLILYWSWVPSDVSLAVTTKSISNARVLNDGGKHPDSLFPKSAKLTQPSEVITLQRLLRVRHRYFERTKIGKRWLLLNSVLRLPALFGIFLKARRRRY
jgi:hypothetical protein